MNAELVKIEIESQIKYLTGQAEERKTKLTENFVYWFPWIGQELWIIEFKLGTLQNLINRAQVPKEFEISVNLEIDNLKDFTTRSYNVRESSSSALHSEVSTWKFMTSMELLKSLETIVKNSML